MSNQKTKPGIKYLFENNFVFPMCTKRVARHTHEKTYKKSCTPILVNLGNRNFVKLNRIHC